MERGRCYTCKNSGLKSANFREMRDLQGKSISLDFGKSLKEFLVKTPVKKRYMCTSCLREYKENESSYGGLEDYMSKKHRTSGFSGYYSRIKEYFENLF